MNLGKAIVVIINYTRYSLLSLLIIIPDANINRYQALVLHEESSEISYNFALLIHLNLQKRCVPLFPDNLEGNNGTCDAKFPCKHTPLISSSPRGAAAASYLNKLDLVSRCLSQAMESARDVPWPIHITWHHDVTIGRSDSLSIDIIVCVTLTATTETDDRKINQGWDTLFNFILCRPKWTDQFWDEKFTYTLDFYVFCFSRCIFEQSCFLKMNLFIFTISSVSMEEWTGLLFFNSFRPFLAITVTSRELRDRIRFRSMSILSTNCLKMKCYRYSRYHCYKLRVKYIKHRF